MDHLADEIARILGRLDGLLDEIGTPTHDRERKKDELFRVVSDAISSHVKDVETEKQSMIDDAKRIIAFIRQLEASLDDTKSDDHLRVTFPLSRCLQVLEQKHAHIKSLHRERAVQVSKLIEALRSYARHLDPSFVRLPLPPTAPHQSIPPTFDLSPAYVDKLDDEFTRVYEEYTRRVATVKALSESVIQLWAELGTPQAQTDPAIVKYYRDTPEQLGLHEEDIARLRARRDKLADEKKSREKRLRDLKAAVDELWDKLGVDDKDRKAFLNANRGCGVRQINEFEDELGRLNELKRQNLHLFVEDARCKLQELWDSLYLSEDEMLEFTPAFSDVYSDALLEAHEREIARLEALREQRAPTLALVDRHKTLIHDRDELAASSQDASRLMGRGQKGERRDPGKLLREEKMRKRIAKELPKISAELRKILECWEDEYGRPFLVHGERYLDVIDMDEKPAPGPRAKTPGVGPPPVAASSTVKSMGMAGGAVVAAALSRAQSVGNLRAAAGSIRGPKTAAPVDRSGAASPTKIPHHQPTKSQSQTSLAAKAAASLGSPTRIPARAPLSNLKNGNNSPERPRPASRAGNGTLGRSNGNGNGNLMRAPPPKMRDLLPPIELETPVNPYKGAGLGSSVVRQVEPEDMYCDDRLASRDDHGDDMFVASRENQRPMSRENQRPMSRGGEYYHQYHSSLQQSRENERRMLAQQQQQQQQQAEHKMQQHSARPTTATGSAASLQPSNGSRQISNTSTVLSGSENWETYDDNSEPEPDASDAYYAKVRAARAAAVAKRATPETAGNQHQARRQKGLPPMQHPGQVVMVDGDGYRIMSGSEWTDEDAF